MAWKDEPDGSGWYWVRFKGARVFQNGDRTAMALVRKGHVYIHHNDGSIGSGGKIETCVHAGIRWKKVKKP